tara:strand:+ start:378 stop:647 length:270 start_codon:yes stop_codon:yes gene_type:complete
MITTIQLDKELKERLDRLKIHHRETYNELISRLINNSNPQNFDKESLIATIEVLSDPEAMRGIKEALEEEQRGEPGTPLEEFEKELGLK